MKFAKKKARKKQYKREGVLMICYQFKKIFETSKTTSKQANNQNQNQNQAKNE